MKKYNYFNLLFLLAFALGLFVVQNEVTFYNFERSIFSTLRHLSPVFDLPFYLITQLGSAVGVISITAIIIIVSVIIKRFFDFGMPIAMVTLSSYLINTTLKHILNRERPDFKLLNVSETSFPSGHSQNNMALYIAILIVVLFFASSKKIRLTASIVCIFMPLVIGVTRIYFGVHYISDVIAGWSVGFIVAYNISFLYFKAIYPKVKKGEPNEMSRL